LRGAYYRENWLKGRGKPDETAKNCRYLIGIRTVFALEWLQYRISRSAGVINKYIKRAYVYKLLIVVLLVSVGIWLDLAGMLDPETILGFTRAYTDY
jgi:hypothetical protein